MMKRINLICDINLTLSVKSTNIDKQLQSTLYNLWLTQCFCINCFEKNCNGLVNKELHICSMEAIELVGNMFEQIYNYKKRPVSDSSKIN